MKVENGAIVMTDPATGKAYVRVLLQHELDWMLAILAPCDGGSVKLQEIAPFIMRSPHISEQEARERVEAAQAQNILGPLIGKSVKVQMPNRKG